MAADGAIGASPETQSALLEEDRTGGKYLVQNKKNGVAGLTIKCRVNNIINAFS